MGDGFSDADILAGLTGPDGYQGMPVIGGGGGDGIDVFIFQHLAQIGIGSDFLFALGVIPWPRKPTTATRISLLAPRTHEKGINVEAAAPAARDRFIKSR